MSMSGEKISLNKETDNTVNGYISTAGDVTDQTSSMWKYNRISGEQPENFPEYRSEAKRLTGCEMIAANVRGRKHKHDGTNCDDWFELEGVGDIAIIAVSDGAGSRAFSRIGAREACRASTSYLMGKIAATLAENPGLRDSVSLGLSDEKCLNACELLASDVQTSVIKAYEAVESAYRERSKDSRYARAVGGELTVKDFACTLLVAVAVPMNNASGDSLVVSFSVGDGAVALIDTKAETKNVKLMGEADSGDYSGETEFLTSLDISDGACLHGRTRIFAGGADLLLLMTDGVADDYFPNAAELVRLYFDLVANGIIPCNDSSGIASHGLPEPTEYTRTDEEQSTVRLNSTGRIYKATGLTADDVWSDRSVLAAAEGLLDGSYRSSEPDEKLRLWLDSYVERGSFDDRTLAAARLNMR